MAKKKNQSNNENKKQVDGGRKNKENDGSVTVVLKIDLHCEGCEGCVINVCKAIRSIKGVESVKKGDIDLKKITVIGKVDPEELRQKVEEKIKKKVELVSPAKKNLKDGGGEKQKKQQKQQTADVKDENKPKKIPVTTTVLKVPLHCQGCIEKIKKLVSKTKGFMEMSIDNDNDLVIVKGGIDVEALKAALKDRLKKDVEVVPPKKNAGGGNGGAGGGGGKKEKGGGGGGGGDGDGETKESGGGGWKVEGQKMEYYGGQHGQYMYPQIYVNGPDYMYNHMHATQMFNDENPNACVVM